jgi:hypothetical protein
MDDPPGHAVCSKVGMKPTLLVVSIALALGTLAGCDRNPVSTPATGATTPATGAATPATDATPTAAGTGSTTPNTPANLGTPSATEKKDGANPVQGQVDPKQEAQKEDFQMKGDGAGPKPGG